MRTTYERVSYRPDGGRVRSIILQDVSESAFLGSSVITGIEVDKTGTRVGSLTVNCRQHVISAELVTKRVPLVMNVHYGLLEEAR